MKALITGNVTTVSPPIRKRSTIKTFLNSGVFIVDL